MACLAGKGGARRARKQNGIDRCRQAAGGAWLGAGPAAERKPSTRCEAASAETDATAAKEARGNAPAGASPTSTAAHAAATLPRIRGSLSPAPDLSTFKGAALATLRE